MLRVLTIAAVLVLAASANGHGIVALPVLPGHAWSSARCVSADGTVVGGISQPATGSGRGVVWTSSTGTLALTTGQSFVAGMSGDGSTLVGNVLSPYHGFRWTAPLGPQPLPGSVSPQSASHDGSVIVGNDFNCGAFRWTAAGGVEALPPLPAHIGSAAHSASASGAVIAGNSWLDPSRTMACRWTAQGVQSLGALPGDDRSAAFGVSADGLVITGYSSNPAIIEHAVRWTEAGGLEDLGVLTGFVRSAGFALNGDGSVIVGEALRYSAGGALEENALMWTRELGLINLNTYLPAIGVDLNGWVLQMAMGVSADGRVMVGAGTFNGAARGWIVTVPAPATALTVACGSLLFLRSRRRSKSA